MYSQNINITHHRGLSLIELMVALVIVSILLLGVTTVYRASKRSYQLNDEVAEVQENARFSLQNMTREIRMAGYTGCDSIKDVALNIISRTPPKAFNDPLPFGANTFVTGHNAAAPNWDAELIIPTNLVAGTDAVTIRKLSACSAGLPNPVAANATIDATANCNFQPGDVLIISDCQTADMFTVTSINRDGHLVHAAAKNTAPPVLNKAYGTDALIFRPELITYYIGTNGTGGQSLYQRRYENRGGAVSLFENELVPNINTMVITYGIDESGNGSVDNLYRRANQVPAAPMAGGAPGENQWSRVVSINLSFTANSDPNVQGVPGGARGFQDTFTTAINLRNNTP